MKRWIFVLGALCVGAAPLAMAQGRVTGTVTAAGDGRPVPGASVVVLGTNRFASTDANGTYTITDVPNGPQQVRTRTIGFAPLTRSVVVSAGADVRADFQLVSAPLQLEGLVVVGYGAQERRDLTGSVSTVTAEQLQETPTANIMQAIQARVPGVDVVAGGGYRPGQPMNVRIRGVRSMVATNEPLFVVDGVPIAGGIEDFNPASIASIEVLKDASATAAYGSRGANGVILVTTQRGGLAGRRASITYDAQYGSQSELNLVDMMNGPEYAEYKRETRRALGQPSVACIAAWSLACDSLTFTPEELPQVTAGTGTDWQRTILRRGQQQRHQLGISVGSPNTRLSVTGTYFGQDGITIGQGFDQYTGTISFENVIGRLRVGATASGARSIADIGASGGLWGEALANSPLGVPYDANGVMIQKPTNDPLRVNPLRQAEGFVRQQTRNRIFGSVFAELQLGRGFSYRVNFGPDISSRTDGQFHGVNTVVGQTPIGNPEASRLDEETSAYTLDHVLNFNRNFGAAGKHRVDATFLYGIQAERYTSTTAFAQQISNEQQLWYNLGTGEVRADIQSNLSKWALQSYMARLNYALAGKYLFTVTGRFDGSSRLAPDNRWAFFPSVGLGWQIGDEAFMDRFTFVSGLKARLSYGRVGNTGINPYQTYGSLDRTRYNSGAASAFGYRPGQIANPLLEWERTTQVDFGLDFGILDNRISGTIDFYKQTTDKLLMNRTLPASTGYTQTLQNIGETANSGWELGLSTVNLAGTRGRLRWTTDLNLTHNHNEIVSLYGLTRDDPGNTWFIGQPINLTGDGLRRVFYDFDFVGVWQLADSAIAVRYGQLPGDIRVRDVNGDSVINAADRIIRGNTYPKMLASVYNRLSMGAFDLSFLFQGRLGYTFNDQFGTANNNLYGRFGNLDVQFWTPQKCDGGPDPLVRDATPSGMTGQQQAAIAGCNANPRPRNSGQDPLYSTARAYRTGTHWRVRNITLGYTLPLSLVSHWRFSSVRIYAQAQDPFVFTSYYGYDPEAGNSSTPPSYRTLLIGATLGF